MSDIYNALAAKALVNFGRCKDRSSKIGEQEEYASKVVDHLNHADDYLRVNEYTWLIKAFYELRQGKFCIYQEFM